MGRWARLMIIANIHLFFFIIFLFCFVSIWHAQLVFRLGCAEVTHRSEGAALSFKTLCSFELTGGTGGGLAQHAAPAHLAHSGNETIIMFVIYCPNFKQSSYVHPISR